MTPDHFTSRLRPIESEGENDGGSVSVALEFPVGPGRTPGLLLHVLGDADEALRFPSLTRALDRFGAFRQAVVDARPAEQRLSSDDLGLPQTLATIGADATSAGQRLGQMTVQFDALVAELEPTGIVLADDSDAALACALVASRRGVPAAHLRAGVRSGDRTPSEANRELLDRLCDLLLVTSNDERDTLLSEGVTDSRIVFTGSTLVDSLRDLDRHARAHAACRRAGVTERKYAFVALRTPEPAQLDTLAHALAALADQTDVVLWAPLPDAFARRAKARGVRLATGKLADRAALLGAAGAVVTDIPIVQEQAAIVGIRCYLLDDFAQSLASITHGTTTMLGADPDSLAAVELSPHLPTPSAIPLWDGHAGERIARALIAHWTLAFVSGGQAAAGNG